jgi:uncharacterized protein YneF (UPF0154 family)
MLIMIGFLCLVLGLALGFAIGFVTHRSLHTTTIDEQKIVERLEDINWRSPESR